MACKYTYNGVEYSKEQLVSKLGIENSNFNTLYNNLVNEITNTETGRKVLDRIKRDYNSKQPLIDYSDIREQTSGELKGKFVIYDNGSYLGKENTLESAKQYVDEINEKRKYTLEEQQEEAIVELLGLMTAEKLNNVKDGKLISLLKRLLKEIKSFVKDLLKQKEIEIDKLPDNMTLGDLSDLLAYSNSKLILPGYEVEYTTPDNMKFKTYQEASNHISKLTKSVKDIDLDNKKLDLTTSNSFTLFDKYGSSVVTRNSYEEAEKYAKDTNLPEGYKIQNNAKNLLNSFITKNKEYEQSKEIIEEWKKVNNIQYNPEEIYSRGQEFSSVVGAYSSFDVNLMMQNLLSHIEDNEKAGGKFAISAYTKPIDKTIGHLEGGGGKIKFKLYPQSNDILWAANTDVYSGSVWDASEKVNKDKKSELLGVSYTKYPSLSNVNTVQPNLASIVDDLSHHHNELAISLNFSNFEIEVDEDVPYQTKKIIDSINKILEQKRNGKLVKPEIKTKKDLTFEEKRLIELNKAKVKPSFLHDNKWEIEGFDMEYYESKEEAEEQLFFFKKNLKERISDKEYLDPTFKSSLPIEPTQTNETLKENIDSVQSKLKAFLDYYVLDYDGNNWVILGQENEFVGSWKNKEDAEKELNKLQPKDKSKEYTEQALINTKIAKLKEVAKKYPRSLIRSEVKRINTSSSQELYDQFGADELPFQKIRSNSIIIKEKEVPLLENTKEENEFIDFGKSCIL